MSVLSLIILSNPDVFLEEAEAPWLRTTNLTYLRFHIKFDLFDHMFTYVCLTIYVASCQ